MNLRINGENKSFESVATLSDLVAELKLGEKRLAIEVNEQIIPKSLYDETKLTPDDTIEIVQAIGGG